jgi:hypothetical protein
MIEAAGRLVLRTALAESLLWVRALEGQFLAKDGVFLGAAILIAAESLRAARTT